MVDPMNDPGNNPGENQYRIYETLRDTEYGPKGIHVILSASDLDKNMVSLSADEVRDVIAKSPELQKRFEDMGIENVQVSEPPPGGAWEIHSLYSHVPDGPNVVLHVEDLKPTNLAYRHVEGSPNDWEVLLVEGE